MTPEAELVEARRRLAELEAVEAERRRAEKVQSGLYRIAELASAAQDMEDFYRALHAVVGELMYANNFFIALYDEESQLINWPYWADEVDVDWPDANTWVEFGSRQSKGTTAYVLRTGETQWLPRERQAELIAQGEFELWGEMSEDWLGAPLTSEGRTVGALVVQSYTKEFTYTEQDKKLLAYVGQHVGAALSRARAIEAQRPPSSGTAALVEELPLVVYTDKPDATGTLGRTSARASSRSSATRPTRGWRSRSSHPCSIPRTGSACSRRRGAVLEAGDERWTMEYRVVAKDGRFVWVRDDAWIVRNEQGEATHIQGFMIDITAEHEAAAELDRQKQYFESLVEISPVAIVDDGRRRAGDGLEPGRRRALRLLAGRGDRSTDRRARCSPRRPAAKKAGRAREALAAGRVASDHTPMRARTDRSST